MTSERGVLKNMTFILRAATERFEQMCNEAYTGDNVAYRQAEELGLALGYSKEEVAEALDRGYL